MSGVQRSARSRTRVRRGSTACISASAHPHTAALRPASPKNEPVQSARCTSPGFRRRIRSGAHNSPMEVTMMRRSGSFAALVIALGLAAAVRATVPTQSVGSRAGEPGDIHDLGTAGARRAIADWSLIAQNAIVNVARRFPGEAAVYMGIPVGARLSHRGDRRSARQLLRPQWHQLLARQPRDRGNPPLRPIPGRSRRGEQRSGVGRLPLPLRGWDGSKLGRKVAQFVVTSFFQPLN